MMEYSGEQKYRFGGRTLLEVSTDVHGTVTGSVARDPHQQKQDLDWLRWRRDRFLVKDLVKNAYDACVLAVVCTAISEAGGDR